jgi:hypothetical protein
MTWHSNVQQRVGLERRILAGYAQPHVNEIDFAVCFDNRREITIECASGYNGDYQNLRSSLLRLCG